MICLKFKLGDIMKKYVLLIIIISVLIGCYDSVTPVRLQDDEIISWEKGAPVIKFYHGQKGVQNIYEDTLSTKEKTVYYVASTKQHIEMAGEDFMRDFVRRRIAKKIKSVSIRMREEEIDERLYKGNKEHLREVRYAPEDIYIPDTVMLYSNKVAIVSTAKENFGFIIESPELYQTLLGFFQALWRISTRK